MLLCYLEQVQNLNNNFYKVFYPKTILLKKNYTHKLISFFLATLRSGFMLQDSADFAESVEVLMRQSLGISLDEKVSYDDDELVADQPAEEEEAEEEEEKEESPEHEEL